jgi:hypothetical protein
MIAPFALSRKKSIPFICFAIRSRASAWREALTILSGREADSAAECRLSRLEANVCITRTLETIPPRLRLQSQLRHERLGAANRSIQPGLSLHHLGRADAWRQLCRSALPLPLLEYGTGLPGVARSSRHRTSVLHRHKARTKRIVIWTRMAEALEQASALCPSANVDQKRTSALI